MDVTGRYNTGDLVELNDFVHLVNDKLSINLPAYEIRNEILIGPFNPRKLVDQTVIHIASIDISRSEFTRLRDLIIERCQNEKLKYYRSILKSKGALLVDSGICPRSSWEEYIYYIPKKQEFKILLKGVSDDKWEVLNDANRLVYLEKINRSTAYRRIGSYEASLIESDDYSKYIMTKLFPNES